MVRVLLTVRVTTFENSVISINKVRLNTGVLKNVVGRRARKGESC